MLHYVLSCDVWEFRCVQYMFNYIYIYMYNIYIYMFFLLEFELLVLCLLCFLSKHPTA
jgi:hypothetical protein